MKYLFASDIHGDLTAARAVVDAYRSEGAVRLFLLGDELYHGPRNFIPDGYGPKGVIALFSEMKDVITAVRGNCDAEVDQMVLPFPILSDYATLPLSNGGTAYLTHGHLFGGEGPVPLGEKDLLIEGHTHVAGVHKTRSGATCLNPGSASMPKGDTPACYMVYDTETGVFTIRRLSDASVFAEYICQ
ncbi:MAG: phosphodiesterase [Clostridia bacterium]|nr:phosphodiesterase [Clostridia bacterium]